ncbi:aldehyde ferredoxin oxidoreductase C-terminal domain-containing protein [Chloroflexota bacterium]
MLDSKIAWIDLTNRTVKSETIPLEWRRKYLGGRGIISFLAWSLTNAKMDPWGPEAPILVGLGWMTGVPSFGCRTFVGGLSTHKQRTAFGTMGGHFGAELKYAGFEQLVIRGKSETPVYLMITDDNIEILDADYLWGLEVLETQEAIRRHHDDQEIKSLVIGPAGENLVRAAPILTGWKNAGGSGWGSGCSMGNKKLKAIAAHGTGDVKLAYPKEFLPWMKEQQDLLLSRKWSKALGRYGSPLLYTVSSNGGWNRSRRTDTPFGERISSITADKLDPYTVRMAACDGCAVHCRHSHYISEGKYAGTMGEGPEYSSQNSYVTPHEIMDWEPILALGDQCNRLGITIGGALGEITELMEEGILTEKDVGSYVGWGDVDPLFKLVDDIVYRRTPFGDAMADGREDSLKKLPPKVADWMVVDEKGRVRGHRPTFSGVKSFSLAQMVNVLPSYSKTNRPGMDVLGLPEKFLEEFYGGPVSNDYRKYDGKDRMVWYHEQTYAIGDCLGVCRFQTIFNCPHAPKWEEYNELIRLTTGMEFSMDELNEITHRITTIERLNQQQHGFGTREDERLPEEWEEQIKGGALAGDSWLDAVKVEEFLDGFYKLHEYDSNGVPPKELVKKLGIAKAKGL